MRILLFFGAVYKMTMDTRIMLSLFLVCSSLLYWVFLTVYVISLKLSTFLQ